MLSDEPENNRLVQIVQDTDFSDDDKNEICLAVAARTVRRGMRRLYAKCGKKEENDGKRT